MTQTTILAAGVSAATSSTVVVAAGATVTIGLFTVAGLTAPSDVKLNITMKTPGVDNVIDQLYITKKQVQISGPGQFVVSRPAYAGDAFGVFVEI